MNEQKATPIQSKTATGKLYPVKLEFFEGPLDLLLYLVDKNQMDITEVALASIAREYENYLNQLQNLNLEIESSFLTVFSSLLQIKSRVLLPAPPSLDEEEEEIPEHELVEQLRQYRLLKRYSLYLEDLKDKMDSSFPRPVSEELTDGAPVLTSQVTPSDLMDIYVNVMRKYKNSKNEPELKVSRNEVSLPFMLRMITRKIRYLTNTSLIELFDSPPNKIRFIVTFLALLELARRRRIELVQKDGESDIIIINKKVKKFKKAKSIQKRKAG